MIDFGVFYWFGAGELVHALDVVSETKISPFFSLDAFAFNVPYMIGDTFPIPYVPEHPMSDILAEIGSLLVSAENPKPGSNVQKLPSLDTPQKRMNYVQQCILYSLVKNIAEIQRGKTQIGYKIQVGAYSDVAPPVHAPNQVEFAPDKLIEMLERHTLIKGDSYSFTLKYSPLKLPMGSDVTIADLKMPMQSGNFKVIRFRNPHLYTLEFGVSANASFNGFPNGMIPQWAGSLPLEIQTMSFTILMNLEITRTAANVFEVDDIRAFSVLL
jgi:hypothetical protein